MSFVSQGYFCMMPELVRCLQYFLKLTCKKTHRKEAILWVNESHVSPLSHMKSQAAYPSSVSPRTTLKFPVFFLRDLWKAVRISDYIKLSLVSEIMQEAALPSMLQEKRENKQRQRTSLYFLF